VADRDIRQSNAADMEPEWRFDIAYNASLQLAVAALAAAGYQAERQNKHQRTIECLGFFYWKLVTWTFSIVAGESETPRFTMKLG